MAARWICRLGIVAWLILSSGPSTLADPPTARPLPSPTDECPSPHYDSILTREVPWALAALAEASPRVQVAPAGLSVGGRPLLLAIVASPENLARLDEVRARRRAMLASMDDLPPGGVLPAIAFINAGSRGNVYAGTDATMALLRTLATDESEATRRILDAVIVVANVTPNPDGRALGSPANGAGLDLGRDLVAQSQPETRAVVEALDEWNPMLFLDVSGFADETSLRAAPPPTRFTGDGLYHAWALDFGHAMSTAVFGASGFVPETVLDATTDEWPRWDLAGYAAFHGAFSFTLEIASRDDGAIVVLEAAMRAALTYAAQHRTALVRDQTRLLARGLLRGESAPSSPDGAGAYLIPADPSHQADRHEAAALVNLLLRNGVAVERALATAEDEGIAAGDYIVRLDQPKGALAATILWTPGADRSMDERRATSGWSLPLAWSVACRRLPRPPDVSARSLGLAPMPLGFVLPGPAMAYAWTPDSNAAIIAANAALRAGASLFRLDHRWTDGEHTFPPGTFVLADDAPLGRALALASEHGIVLSPLTVLPQGLERLRHPLIAAHGDPAAALVLRELGFDVTTVTTEELGVGRTLDAFDVLVVSGGAPLWPRLSDAARQALWEYARRGGAIVGLGYAGTDLAVALGLADVDPTVTAPNFSGMARIVCDADDPIVGSYTGATPVLVRAPVWYTYLGEGATPLATYSPAAPLITGYWPLWNDINPAGQATIVRLSGGGGGITLFGFDPTDAAYGRGAFRLLAQAIYRPWPDAGP